jgi:hypothetical protein
VEVVEGVGDEVKEALAMSLSKYAFDAFSFSSFRMETSLS